MELWGLELTTRGAVINHEKGGIVLRRKWTTRPKNEKKFEPDPKTGRSAKLSYIFRVKGG